MPGLQIIVRVDEDRSVETRPADRYYPGPTLFKAFSDHPEGTTVSDDVARLELLGELAVQDDLVSAFGLGAGFGHLFGHRPRVVLVPEAGPEEGEQEREHEGVSDFHDHDFPPVSAFGGEVILHCSNCFKILSKL